MNTQKHGVDRSSASGGKRKKRRVWLVILILATIFIGLPGCEFPVNQPNFHVGIYADLLDATQNDAFIVPKLDRYDGDLFGCTVFKKNHFATGDGARYGRHTGYAISGRAVPNSSFVQLTVGASDVLNQYNELNPKPELIFTTSYNGIDLQLGVGDATILDESFNYIGQEYPVGSLSSGVGCMFDIHNYRYLVSGRILLAPDEFNVVDITQIMAEAEAEIMEIVRSIIDQAE